MTWLALSLQGGLARGRQFPARAYSSRYTNGFPPEAERQ